jgi:hypothetical protein
MEEVGFLSCCIFLTTEYTEAVEPYLKNTEMGSVYSVWERSDLSVKFCGKKVGRRGRFWAWEKVLRK